MSQIIFGFIFFLLGYVYCKYTFAIRQNKIVLSTSKLMEMSLYIALKDYVEMNNHGLNALKLVLDNCSEDQKEMSEEYKKIINIYNNKIEQFGNFYMMGMNQVFPYELKFKSYKEVKEAFNMLYINEESKKDA